MEPRRLIDLSEARYLKEVAARIAPASGAVEFGAVSDLAVEIGARAFELWRKARLLEYLEAAGDAQD
jgi:hypothetical protein